MIGSSKEHLGRAAVCSKHFFAGHQAGTLPCEQKYKKATQQAGVITFKQGCGAGVDIGSQKQF